MTSRIASYLRPLAASVALPLALALGLAAASTLAGCTPSIGDKCVLSTDCSISGDRLCDTSQPGGYCTIFNCAGNSCPNNGTCVFFHPQVQGCTVDDRSISRTGRSFCMATCDVDSDCRSGYVCRSPKDAPWNALVLDNEQRRKVCIVPETTATGSDSSTSSTAPVCSADGGPTLSDYGDAGATDAAVIDAAKPADAAASDASDAGAVDASDAASGADAADAGTD